MVGSTPSWHHCRVSVTFRRPSADEYAAWSAAALREYANDIVAAGLLSRREAEEKALRDDAEMVPDGLDTAGHFIYRVEADGHPIGWLWYGMDKPQNPTPGVGFIYDISIDEPFRGQGYGRTVMEMAEEDARHRGLRALALHVFGTNAVARSLYASLGYRETSVQMQKEL
jgi:mycothiol synthase